MRPADLRPFWRERKGWPVRDLPGTIFLGRAIHATGEALFPRDWTGDEPVAFIPTPLRPLAASPPVYPGRSLAAHRGGDVPRPVIDADDWVARVQRRLEEIEAQKPIIADATAAVLRWSAVRERLLGWLLAGEIGFAVRFDNGSHAPAARAIWNGAKADEHFAACRLPFSNGWSSVMLPVDLDESDFRGKLESLTPGRSRVETTSGAERRAIAILETMMKASPDAPLTNAASKAEVERQLGQDIAERSFQRAKAAAVLQARCPAWASGGRPKKTVAE